MYKTAHKGKGFGIENIAVCDFSKLEKIDNEEIVRRARGGKADERLLTFIKKNFGINNRYWTTNDQNAYTLAYEALERLLRKDPGLKDEAEFIILGGISNPMPTVCQSALLSNELGLNNVSCWDLKSGCSTGVLSLIQAQQWFERGAKKGIIVCSETFSKFTNPDILQMASAIGDGAVALSIVADDSIEFSGAVHGTDARYFKTMYVPGIFPVKKEDYNPSNFIFHFEQKGDASKMLSHYWNKSLKDLLELCEITGQDIDYYFSHQVNGTKNYQIAKSFSIEDKAIALNFENFGNMGCPTIFINYYYWMNNKDFLPGQKMVFHAVGGGLSWAALCLTKAPK